MRSSQAPVPLLYVFARTQRECDRFIAILAAGMAGVGVAVVLA